MQSLPELVLGLKAARKHKEALLEQLPKTREAALALADQHPHIHPRR